MRSSPTITMVMYQCRPLSAYARKPAITASEEGSDDELFDEEVEHTGADDTENTCCVLRDDFHDEEAKVTPFRNREVPVFYDSLLLQNH